MLYYAEADLSHLEVPGETCLCLYISGCLHKCKGCHYSILQDKNTGLPLSKYIYDLVELYISKITCVCYLGEGNNSAEEKHELIKYSKYVHSRGLKSCLYSGSNTSVEDWMKTFDYIKLGAYDSSRGGLSAQTTNQMMLQKDGNSYIDITYKFWDTN